MLVEKDYAEKTYIFGLQSFGKKCYNAYIAGIERSMEEKEYEYKGFKYL